MQVLKTPPFRVEFLFSPVLPEIIFYTLAKNKTI